MIELLSSNTSHNLEKILSSHDMKKSELAKLLNLDPSVISGWVSGKRILTMDSRKLIAEKLKIDVNELTDFCSEIPIVGYAEYLDYRVIEAKLMDKIQSLKIKTSIVPENMQGIMMQRASDYNWRRDTIWVFKNKPDGCINEKRVHPLIDYRLAFAETDNGVKYIAEVRKTPNHDRYSLHAIHGGEPLPNCSDIELNWAVPIYGTYHNHTILDTSFTPTLD